MRLVHLLPLLALACAPTASKDADDDDTLDPVEETETDGATDTEEAADSDDPEDSEDPAETDAVDSDEPVDSDVGPETFAPGAYTDFNSSGTRLTAHALVSEEGNDVVTWFFDEDLETRCVPTVAADGATRCLPESNPLWQSLGAYFLDAACTQPVALVQDDCSAEDYYREAFTGGTRVYTQAGYAPTIYNLGGRGGACQQIALPAGQDAIALTEVPSADFVAFTGTSVAVDSEVAVQVLEGEDGSSMASGLWHVEEAQPGVLTSGRLVPYAHSLRSDELVSADCGGGLMAYVASTVTPTPAYMEFVPMLIQGGPGGPWGPPVPGPPEFREIVGTQQTWCEWGSPQTVDGSQTVYLVGATAVPLTDFPALTVAHDLRSDQRFDHLVTAAGDLVRPYPPGTGLPSVRIDGVGVGLLAYDGALVQAPAAFSEVQLFADASCNVPLADGSFNPGDLLIEYAWSAALVCSDLPGAPGEAVGVYTVDGGTAFTRTLYVWNGSECLQAGSGPARSVTAVADPTTVLPALEAMDL
jgi:hypothetical protein